VAKYVMKDTYIGVNGTAISDHANTCELEDTADEVDFTAFSTAGYKEIAPGLKDATVTATLFADFAASSVHAILQPLYQSGGTFALEIRPTSSAASATNPKATMTARLFSYSGIAGGIGDAATFDAVFRNAGTAGLTWATT
jgi:hypothetical protein